MKFEPDSEFESKELELTVDDKSDYSLAGLVIVLGTTDSGLPAIAIKIAELDGIKYS
jgi:hypothetical protein